MCSLSDSITNLFSGKPPLKQVFPPCLHGDGSKNVNIRIFDKFEFVNDMAEPDVVVSNLQSFLRGLASQEKLEPDVAARLSSITFNVAYEKNRPSQAEIDRLGVNDFPIYLLTATAPFDSTPDDIVSLLNSHKLPKQTFVFKRRQPDSVPPEPFPIASYKDIEDDWANKPTVLGFGFPGPYFIPRTQNMCRKLGIIKMKGGMIENLPSPDRRRKKIVSVLKHELGHMFGLKHEDQTLMDPKYDVNVGFDSYTNDQLWIAGRALELLLQS
jgi:hypothetical protein